MSSSQDTSQPRVVADPGMCRSLLPGNRRSPSLSPPVVAGTASGRPEAVADDEREGEVGPARSSREASEQSGLGCGGAKRLETIPGIGVIGASAIAATVADPTVFRSGRDFAAWIGLVPRQDSTGGKQKLGPISKQGDRYLRRILVVGAHSVLRRAKQNPPRNISGSARLVRAVLRLNSFLDRSDQRLHGLKLRRQHNDARRASIGKRASFSSATIESNALIDWVRWRISRSRVRCCIN